MKVTREDAVELWKILADGQWRKQKNIPMEGVRVRSVAQTFAPFFISNTASGYRRTDLAEEEEIRHSINDLRSRAKKMLARADKLESYLFNERQGQL